MYVRKDNFFQCSNLFDHHFFFFFFVIKLGRTPLHYAMAMSKMEEMGRILIHSGAEKVIRDVVCIYI